MEIASESELHLSGHCKINNGRNMCSTLQNRRFQSTHIFKIKIHQYLNTKLFNAHTSRNIHFDILNNSGGKKNY